MNKYYKHVYEYKGKYHLDYYKMIESCVYRLSNYHSKWILCLDEKIINQIKDMEK